MSTKIIALITALVAVIGMAGASVDMGNSFATKNVTVVFPHAYAKDDYAYTSSTEMIVAKNDTGATKTGFTITVTNKESPEYVLLMGASENPDPIGSSTGVTEVGTYKDYKLYETEIAGVKVYMAVTDIKNVRFFIATSYREELLSLVDQVVAY